MVGLIWASCVQHHLLRLYASAHLAALYLMLVDNLEGMPGLLHSLLPMSVLRSLGMDQPSMAKGMVPPLLCIVLVRLSLLCIDQLHTPQCHRMHARSCVDDLSFVLRACKGHMQKLYAHAISSAQDTCV